MKNRYKRQCPKCGKDIYHSTEEYCRSREIRQTPCKSCGCRNPARLKKMSEMNTGKNNPFYGKKHTEESLKRIGGRDYSVNKTEEFRAKISLTSKGVRNPMYGRSIYDVWVKRHGQEDADRRMSELKKKRSEQMRGSGNNMYGKPSPQGSGNGWSGWYKGWYFRSLKELSYMILVIEANGYEWRSAESRDLKIPYIMDGVSRTYFADFFIGETILVEVKPKKLMDSRLNSLKKEAALKFCRERGYSYRMVDVRTLEDRDVADLYRSGAVRFIGRYDIKMKQRLGIARQETK